MWEQILPGLRIKLFMTLVLGVVYPLAITGISQVFFPHQANGSLITKWRQGNRIGNHRAELHQAGVLPSAPSAAGRTDTTPAPAGAPTWPHQRKADRPNPRINR